MRPITVSFGDSADKAKITRVQQYPWSEFAKILTTKPPALTSKDALGWYIPATFRDNYRDKPHFISRDAVTYDIDRAPPGAFEHVQAMMKKAPASVMYTTFSHTDAAPRFRIVMPISRAANFVEYEALSRKLAQQIGILDLVAPESFRPCQFMYMPVRPGSSLS